MRGPEQFQSHHSVSLTLRLVSPGYWQPGCFSRCRRFLWAASSMPAAVCGGAGMWDHNIPLTRKPTNSHFFLAFFPPSQRTSLGKHWCILRWGWVCCGWRGFCSSSRVEEELSASTTTKGQRLWAWPWRGATRSCTSFWQSKDDLVVPLLVFRSLPCLVLLYLITQCWLSAILHP